MYYYLCINDKEQSNDTFLYTHRYDLLKLQSQCKKNTFNG